MIESIEGKRGLPRHKPPLPIQVGLFGRPTLIHNVETLYWIRDLVERGPDWWTRPGPQRPQGPARLFGLGARRRARRQDRAGRGHGPRADRRILRRHAAGPHASRPTCRAGRRAASCRPRWATSRSTSARSSRTAASSARPRSSSSRTRTTIQDAALNLMRFFADESCGQCTPCRGGTEKAVELMGARGWDEPLLNELSAAMRDASICGLGQAAPNPRDLGHEALSRPTWGSSDEHDRVHHRRPRGRGRRRRDDLAGRPAPRGRDPASLLLARAGLPARRQLPRLHGRDRGRARAGRLLRPQADAGHEGRRRHARAPKPRAMVFELLLADQPERATAHDPDSKFWHWADTVGVTDQPLPRGRAAAAATSAIRRWRSSSTPASSAASASAPAARSRSTT